MEGVYATCAPGDANAVEAYFLRDTGSQVRHSGEHRDIWGLRAAAKVGPVALEFEPVYESGKVFNPEHPDKRQRRRVRRTCRLNVRGRTGGVP